MQSIRQGFGLSTHLLFISQKGIEFWHLFNAKHKEQAPLRSAFALSHGSAPPCHVWQKVRYREKINHYGTSTQGNVFQVVLLILKQSLKAWSLWRKADSYSSAPSPSNSLKSGRDLQNRHRRCGLWDSQSWPCCQRVHTPHDAGVPCCRGSGVY